MAKAKVNRTGIKFLAPASNQEFAVGALPESVEDAGLIERFAGLIGVAGELRADGQAWLDHRAARPAVDGMVGHGIKSRQMQIALLRQEADTREMADAIMMEVHNHQRETRTNLGLAARSKRQELLDKLAAQGYTDTAAFGPATRQHAAVRQLRESEDVARNAAQDFWMRASQHRGNAKWCRDKAETLYREIIDGNLSSAVYHEPTGNPGEYDDRQEREERRKKHFRGKA